jgi:predicted transcriptional regulator
MEEKDISQVEQLRVLKTIHEKRRALTIYDIFIFCGLELYRIHNIVADCRKREFIKRVAEESFEGRSVGYYDITPKGMSFLDNPNRTWRLIKRFIGFLVKDVI